MSMEDFQGEAYAYGRLFREKQPALVAKAHEDAMIATWRNVARMVVAGVLLALIFAAMRAR